MTKKLIFPHNGINVHSARPSGESETKVAGLYLNCFYVYIKTGTLVYAFAATAVLEGGCRLQGWTVQVITIRNINDYESLSRVARRRYGDVSVDNHYFDSDIFFDYFRELTEEEHNLLLMRLVT